MSEEVSHVDWLGNRIRVGDWVLYSSKSVHCGMNLGLAEYIGPTKTPPNRAMIIQIRIVSLTSNRSWSRGKLVTLSKGTSAYRSVTKYSDQMIRFDLEIPPVVVR